MIKPTERIHFGKHKGQRLIDLPDSYLKWMERNLRDSDLHQYSTIAKDILARRQEDDKTSKNLEQAANEFLRRHGYDPYNL